MFLYLLVLYTKEPLVVVPLNDMGDRNQKFVRVNGMARPKTESKRDFQPKKLTTE